MPFVRSFADHFCIVLVDCEWDEWGDWSTCSLTCGGGEQTRSRVILRPEAFGGVPCVGPPEETRACNEDACPGKTKMIKFITIYNKQRKHLHNRIIHQLNY